MKSLGLARMIRGPAERNVEPNEYLDSRAKNAISVVDITGSTAAKKRVQRKEGKVW